MSLLLLDFCFTCFRYSKATHPPTVISDTSSGSCITEVPVNSKNVTTTDQIQQHLGQISAEVTKLQNLCTSVENEFVSTKNDMGNLQVRRGPSLLEHANKNWPLERSSGMILFRNYISTLLLGEFDITTKSGGSFRFKVSPMCDPNEVDRKTSCNSIKRKIPNLFWQKHQNNYITWVVHTAYFFPATF